MKQMAHTTDLIPDDVLAEASQEVTKAQTENLQLTPHFFKTDSKTGESYLFDLIDELPQGFVLEGEKGGPRSVSAQKISTIRLSNLPYSVFEVVNCN
jgi:hypothetical protein